MPAARVDVTVGDRTISLSNPDKPYFPELGDAGTKLTLARYYAAVSGALMETVGDRPTYLQRYPDGIKGEEIYQKRLPPKAPEWLERVTIHFPSRRSAEVLRPSHPADFVWATQFGTITFHPWPAHSDDLEHPDLMRIDLDPQPGTDFRDAALVGVEVLKPMLESLNLVGYPKTSGSRGIHVDVPIQQKWTFAEVRRAVLALAREMERVAPERVTSAWWKEQRGERVFIDFNQMLSDRTIASAYSVRPRPTATVSTPLTWDEVPAADPLEFTMATVPQRLSSLGNIQADMSADAGSLDELMAWVARDEERGLGEANYPPNYPKMPGEPPRVQPSKKQALNWETPTE
ncbi:MAG TPA: DNA primase small subunit domain-containing protein [Actinomycetes bacterium]|nr:DNA primase small subunit domain-containing protein [Actinomycetes bacterium]